MKQQHLEYTHQNTVLENYMAIPENITSKVPTVLVFHAWQGRDEFACGKANALTELGYIGIALDLYGKGVIAHSREESSQLMQPFLKNRSFLKSRILAALESVRSHPSVDPDRIAAIGFCFGGLCALDLARLNIGIRAVVSFHGLLGTPDYKYSDKTDTKILALHGHDDPMVKPEAVGAFQKEMDSHRANWEMNIYGNTMHAFTVPDANDSAFGTVYNENAAERSWSSMSKFLRKNL